MTEPKIDLNDLLFTTPGPAWEDVVAFFRDGEFHETHYEKQAIRKYLLTEDQLTSITRLGLSLGDMLHGRFNAVQSAVVTRVFTEWNTKLGFVRYGLSRP